MLSMCFRPFEKNPLPWTTCHRHVPNYPEELHSCSDLFSCFCMKTNKNNCTLVKYRKCGEYENTYDFAKKWITPILTGMLCFNLTLSYLLQCLGNYKKMFQITSKLSSKTRFLCVHKSILMRSIVVEII